MCFFLIKLWAKPFTLKHFHQSFLCVFYSICTNEDNREFDLFIYGFKYEPVFYATQKEQTMLSVS